MLQQFTNNSASTLAANIGGAALSLTVATGEGALFPTLTGGQFFLATLCKVSSGIEYQFEVVQVTARSGDIFTIVRAQEGTTAQSYLAGDRVSLRLTAGGLASFEAVENKDATGGYAGLTLFKINFKNALNTFTSFFTNANTAARTYTFPDYDATMATVAGTETLSGKTLAAHTLSGDITGGDYKQTRTMLQDVGNVFLDKGNSGTSTQTLDYTAGSHQKITATGNYIIATSNWPPTGNLGELLLELTNGAAYTITWPTVNWVKSDGTTTTTFASNGVTLQSSGTDFVLLWSRNAGTTIYGKVVR